MTVIPFPKENIQHRKKILPLQTTVHAMIRPPADVDTTVKSPNWFWYGVLFALILLGL